MNYNSHYKILLLDIGSAAVVIAILISGNGGGGEMGAR